MSGSHSNPTPDLTELHKQFSPGLVRHFERKLRSQVGAGSPPRASAAAHGDLADELAQRTWIEFWKLVESGRYDPARAKPSTYLYGVASIIWLRNLRERGRDRRVTDLPDDDAWLPASTYDDPIHAAELAVAVDAIRRIVGGNEIAAPFTDADRLLLRSISEDRTEREIADHFSISPSTAHERKRALLARMADYLKARGFDFFKDSRAEKGGKGEEQLPSAVQESIDKHS